MVSPAPSPPTPTWRSQEGGSPEGSMGSCGNSSNHDIYITEVMEGGGEGREGEGERNGAI